MSKEILGVATQKSELELSETTRKLKELLDSPDPLPGPLTSPRQGIIRDLRRRCSSPCTQQPILWRRVPVRFISGSKRGIRETEIPLQCVDGLCHSQLSEGPPKKFRQLGHQVHMKWPGACDSNFCSKNSFGEDCDTPKTSVSKSSEENFQFIRNIDVNRMPSNLDSLPSNEVSKNYASIIVRALCVLPCLRAVRWFSKTERSVPAETRVEVISKKAAATGWESLPNDLQANILQRVEFRDLFRFKILSKACKFFIEGDAFRQSRGAISEGSFTAINYYIKNNAWQCSGFDLHSKTWRALPTLSYLPPPDAELFKEYSVTCHGGLMCAEVSKLPKKGELVVFNPLTGDKRALPPLLYPRNPVLVHISVNSAERSFKVIVAGSSTASDEHLSHKTEVFDSSTSEWKETCDLPGPAFGLNEHQAGVCLNGKLFIISFLEGDCHRGVVAFDVEKGEWLKNMACPIPFSSYSNSLQLVENDGKVYLFSEQEQGASVGHCIYELEFPNPKAGVMACRWRNVVQVKKSGGRGLLVYPEHTCVGFGEGKLCIFNTLNRDGVVYDMRGGQQCEVLDPPPPDQKGDNFFSMNPASFTLQPNFIRMPVSEC